MWVVVKPKQVITAVVQATVQWLGVLMGLLVFVRLLVKDIPVIGPVDQFIKY
jgi:hypothetical protein